MAFGKSAGKWTPDDSERLKRLVLKHVSNGGTVVDACEQFELETNGVYSKRMNQMRWFLTLRSASRPEYRRAQEIGRKAKMIKLKQQYEHVEEEFSTQQPTMVDDELSTRLISSVLEMVEDRRQLAVSLEDHKGRLESVERNVDEFEEERKLTQLRFEKKERELDKLQKHSREQQFKYDQLAEDYQQMRINDAKEFETVQMQLKEMHAKFENLTADYSRFRANAAKESERLEAAVRDEQVRYSQLLTKYNKAAEDNANLMKRITDFAQQMTAFMPQEVAPSGTLSTIPMRPVASKGSTDVAGL
jgi:DNA repair exonuclease SbcCD ATPase subunit